MKRNICLVLLLVLLYSLTLPCSADMISEQQELQIGMEGAAKLEAQYGTCNDPAQLQRIAATGQKIVPMTERPNLKFTFKILNVEKVNALAFPGGFVYVTRGLLPYVDDQELGFVLGHEIAHVAKRHSIHQMEKQMYTQLGLFAVVALFNKGEVDQGSMNVVQMASTVIGNQYSREDELEADIASCNYMKYALKYNPRAAIGFMEKLKKLSGEELPGFLNSLVGDHPLAEERERAIDGECRRLGY
jgi:beta-barrel assembly-enhancing protease